jgi:hypothetical protein
MGICVLFKRWKKGFNHLKYLDRKIQRAITIRAFIVFDKIILVE